MMQRENLICNQPPECKIYEKARALIDKTLLDFVSSSKCCLEFPLFFTKIQRDYIHAKVKDHGIRSCVLRKMDDPNCVYVKVYKDSCNDFLDHDDNFALSNSSRKEILKFFQEQDRKGHLPENSSSSCENYDYERKQHQQQNSSFNTTHEQYKKGILKKPHIPIVRFTIVTNDLAESCVPPSRSIDRCHEHEKQELEDFTKTQIYKYKNEIIKTINQKEITMISGEIGYEKAINIPQFILDDHAERNQHCRVICAQNYRLSALYTSERVAKARGEQLGQTVGFQIRLESVASWSTNLLYTTTNFFLRCLMGSSSENTLKSVTHVIIDDLQFREANSDLLLLEIKKFIDGTKIPIKIILMCTPTNVQPFTEYFPQGILLQLAPLEERAKIIFLDEILLLTNYRSQGMNAILTNLHRKRECKHSTNQKVVDKILEDYMLTGNNEVFSTFLYMVQAESVPIDVQHSRKPHVTALMGAIQNERIDHAIKLINSNYDLVRFKEENYHVLMENPRFETSICFQYVNLIILQYIVQMESLSSSDAERILYAYENSRIELNDEVDHDLICAIISHLSERNKCGKILIFLPNYTNLLQLQYKINSSMLCRKLPGNLVIHLLHENINKPELEEILKATFRDSNELQRLEIILSTEVGEVITLNHSMSSTSKFLSIIDSGRISTKSSHDIEKNIHVSSTHMWIFKETMNRRASIAHQHENSYCFRLYSKKKAKTFSNFTVPELLRLRSLHKICLYAKLLSPFRSLNEYFSYAIQAPPEQVIEENGSFLKMIGVFDESEFVTSMGMRLADIPIDLQLGKTLIYSISLRCLDPMLTIISSLTFENPINFLYNVIHDDKNDDSTQSSSSGHRHFGIKMNKCKESILAMAKLNSDHLLILKCFQKWQKDICSERNIINLNLDYFVLNGVMEYVSVIRAQIIGSLRASNLVHSTGILSMKSLNENSDNWALVKGCFTAGMYPNFCRLTNKDISKVKSLYDDKIIVARNSVLRLNEDQEKRKFQTDWILFQNKRKINQFTNIECNTLVTPLTISIFGGNPYVETNNDLYPVWSSKYLEFGSDEDISAGNRSQKDIDTFSPDENGSYIYNVNNWIRFRMNKEDAVLIFNLKESLNNLILGLIENPNRFRKLKSSEEKRFSIINTISKILYNEDIFCGFNNPDNIGERPKALPIKFRPVLTPLRKLTGNTNVIPIESTNVIDSEKGSLTQDDTMKNNDGELDKHKENSNPIRPANEYFFILKITTKDWDEFLAKRTKWKRFGSLRDALIQRCQLDKNCDLKIFLFDQNKSKFCCVTEFCQDSNKKENFLKEILRRSVSLLEFRAIVEKDGNLAAFNDYINGREIPLEIGRKLFNCF